MTRSAVSGGGAERVTVRVPAKVNLQLSVGPLRPDGFHELATVFCAVSLYDEVSVELADSLRVTVDGLHARGVPLGEDNLSVRAVRLLAAAAGVQPDLHLHLHKNIPVAGGLGGGSADAAGALVASAELWGLDHAQPRLRQLAGRLGSDVPFALLGGAAIGQGRGEVLTRVPVGKTFSWVVASADGELSTPAVYAESDRLRGVGAVKDPLVSAPLLRAMTEGDAEALAAALSNDLQPAACSLRPELAGTLAAGRRRGALAALVSGSGPTCLFLARDADHAEALSASLVDLPDVRGVHVVTGPVPGPSA